MANVEIYATSRCPYCDAVKRYFEKKGVQYREIDVSHDPAKRKWLVDVTQQRTVPQVFIDNRPYGGYTDILALDQQGELDVLLGLSTSP